VPTNATLTINASTSSGAVNTQTFGTVTLAANSTNNLTAVNAVIGSGTQPTLTVNLGGFTRSAATSPTTANSGTGSVLNNTPPAANPNTTFTTTASTTNGILVDGAGTAFAVVGGLNWASKSGSNIIPFTAYTNDTFGPTVNDKVTGGFTVAAGNTS